MTRQRYLIVLVICCNRILVTLCTSTIEVYLSSWRDDKRQVRVYLKI